VESDDMLTTTLRLAGLLAGLALVPGAARAADASDQLLEWGLMTPVIRPFTGAADAIRGVNGGGRPWTITLGRGQLRSDGRIEVEVRGLVLADTLVNPIPAFRAVVSCLTVDATGAAATVNAQTDPAPATPQGDAEIEGQVELPSPCIAPIVFVTSPGGAWFAATGH
jgi:hypothetical protein